MPKSKGDAINRPAPQAVQQFFDSLGLLPATDSRQSLWQDLIRFHEDPLHEYRRYMNLSQHRQKLKTEVHNFLRQHGEHYFSQEHLEPGVAVYQENPSTEEIFTTYEPLFEALLYLCKRACQKRNQELNKEEWKQWEIDRRGRRDWQAPRKCISSASGHEDSISLETVTIDDTISVLQSESDDDYVPPKRRSSNRASSSRSASPEYRLAASRQAQDYSLARHRKSERAVSSAQKKELRSYLLISSDDTEPHSSPTQEAPLTRGAATRLTSAASSLMPSFDLETSKGRMYEQEQPSLQHNNTQSSYESPRRPASTTPVPSNTVYSSEADAPLSDPGALAGLQPFGTSPRMSDHGANSIDVVAGINGYWSAPSNTRHPGTETSKKRPRDGSLSLIPENQGGPAKFNGTGRHRPSPDHTKLIHNHTKPAGSRQPSTAPMTGEPATEPCARTFTPINNERGLQEHVSPEKTGPIVPQWFDQPLNPPKSSHGTVPSSDQRPAETIRVGPLNTAKTAEHRAPPSTNNTSTVENPVKGKEAASGAPSTDRPAPTAGDHSSINGSFAAKPTPPARKRLKMHERPEQNVKADLFITNGAGIVEPWSYGKLSDMTPATLFEKIARDNKLCPEHVESVDFSILHTAEAWSVTVDRESVRPGAALRTMALAFLENREGSFTCDILAQPMVSEDVKPRLTMDEL